MKQILILPNFNQDSTITYLTKENSEDAWHETSRADAFSQIEFPDLEGCKPSALRGIPRETLETYSSEKFVLGQFLKTKTPLLSLTKSLLGKDNTNRIVFLSWIIQSQEFSSIEALNLQKEIPEILEALKQPPIAYTKDLIKIFQKDLQNLANGGDSINRLNEMLKIASYAPYQWYSSVPLLGTANRPDSQYHQQEQPIGGSKSLDPKHLILIGLGIMVAGGGAYYLHHWHKSRANTPTELAQGKN